MSAIIIESFDNFTDTVLPGPFDSLYTDSGSETIHNEFTISAAYGRDHSSGLRLHTGDYHEDGRGRLYTFVNYLTSCVIGVAIYIETAGIGSLSRESYQRVPFPILTFYDGDSPQVTIIIDGAMRVRVYAGAGNDSPLETSLDALHENVWHYLELDITFGNIIGAIAGYLDGKTIISLTNIDTVATANTFITSVALGGWGSYNPFGFAGMYVRFDDFYLFDKNGSTNNAVVGDVQIKGLLPVSDGPKKEWAPSTGTLHYDMVDDTVPPFMTNYIGASSGNVIDVWRYGTISIASGTIRAVTINPYAQKPNTAIVAMTGIISDGSTYSAGSDLYLSFDGQYYRSIHETNPIAGGRFTLSQLAAYYFGVKRTI